MSKNNPLNIQQLKAMQKYVKEYTPYMLDLFVLTLKESTDMSNEDIEYIIDAFQEVATRGLSMTEVHQQVIELTGLDLYSEPDKAGRSK